MTQVKGPLIGEREIPQFSFIKDAFIGAIQVGQQQWSGCLRAVVVCDQVRQLHVAGCFCHPVNFNADSVQRMLFAFLIEDVARTPNLLLLMCASPRIHW
jgi:hypothetical protein